ncbi:tyrosine-type recombinase/integrase [Companilactobacillus metriopterae]|uniref:site-specific integrase n=1 Tax=Companilactobacillus metriopterae TaxID=1909267 RepID=UPI00100AE52A|nr:tyrosine-type recombinase/integrase [Companilactobacillus metriopterae]
MASITKRNGKWQYRVSYKDPETGKYRTKSKSGFDRKIDAQNEANELEIAKSKKFNISGNSVTFANYFKEWIETYKIEGKSQSTINRYYFTVKLIESYFPDTLLSDVTKKDYQQFINEFSKNRTQVTVAKYNSFIKAMALEAIDEGIIHRDFTKNVTLIGGKESRSDNDKFLEPKDFITLINISRIKSNFNNVSAMMIYLCCQTGMRYEEITGLSWDKINFDDLLITVDKAYTKYLDDVKTTKTSAGSRIIVISQECADVLKDYKLEQELYFKKINYINPQNYICRTKHKKIVTSKTVNDTLKEILSLAGISKMIKFHDIRHTHISYLIDMGINPQYVSRRAGHKELKTTYKYYTHLFDETSKKESQSLQSLFNRVNEQ